MNQNSVFVLVVVFLLAFFLFLLLFLGHQKKNTLFVAAYCAVFTWVPTWSAIDGNYLIFQFFFVCFGVQVLSFSTRLSPVCSLLHFMVPAYSESVYATDVLRLCESAFFSHPPPSAALSQGDDVTQSPPTSESPEDPWGARRAGLAGRRMFVNRSDRNVAKMSCHWTLPPLSTGCNGAGVAEPLRSCYDSRKKKLLQTNVDMK